ncbi:unnamed protein product [Lepidochelys kempii]
MQVNDHPPRSGPLEAWGELCPLPQGRKGLRSDMGGSGPTREQGILLPPPRLTAATATIAAFFNPWGPPMKPAAPSPAGPAPPAAGGAGSDTAPLRGGGGRGAARPAARRWRVREI